MNVQLLRDSFALVVERAPNLTSRFYDQLFNRFPQSKLLFGRNARNAQERMLTDALVAVVEHVEDGAWMTSTLEGLGAKHVGYGVTDEMYGWVGESLLATLAEVAGPDWTPETAETWAAAYGAIAGLMQQGARKAQESAA
jgi:hemoglobin-like flavoprotein